MQVLDIGIIGAGIAGLGSAIALRRSGHTVTIFEKSQFKNEVGAAITFTPNSNRVLHHWGLDLPALGETLKLQARHLNSETLEYEQKLDFTGAEERYGYVLNGFHRVDIHKGLREKAEELGVKIHLGREVVDLDCEAGTFTTNDGETFTKDLIVLADGFNCKFHAHITGDANPVSHIPRSLYRALIPFSRIHAHPTVGPLLFPPHSRSGFCNTTSAPTGLLLVTYPCRHDSVLNLALFHATHADEAHKSDWNSPARVADAVAECERAERETGGKFHGVWKELVACADEMKVYTLGWREPLERMVRGRCVLVGDAAHPMMPTHAQGAAMAVEDAAALGEVFARGEEGEEVVLNGVGMNGEEKGEGKNEESVEEMLELYNSFRLPRAVVTQMMSNGMFYWDSRPKISDTIRRHYSGKRPDAETAWFSEEIQDFFYRYNVFAEAQKMLSWKRKEGSLPPRKVIEENLFGLK
ncbi:MAG: hypothetical protein Q9165_007372 [Trypethelium subeluteriae]